MANDIDMNPLVCKLKGHAWCLKSNFLLATALIVACLAVASCESQPSLQLQHLQATNATLERENRRLRNEVGELTVGDAQQVNVVQAPQHDPYTWKWRLWIPKNKSYTVRAASGEVPAEGFPQAMGVPVEAVGEEGWCEYRIVFNPVKKVWEQTLQVSASVPDVSMAGAGSGSFINWPVLDAWWLENPNQISKTSSEGVSNFVREIAPERNITLLRKRVWKSGALTNRPAGFVVWLEPQRTR